MLDGPIWSVFRITVLLLLLSHPQASGQVGSNLAPAPSPGSSDCFKDDRCTLQTFRSALVDRGGAVLTSWENDANLNSWRGVTWQQESADGGQVYVEKLELGSLNLSGINGTYPVLHEGLPSLKTLNISGNNLTGTLPSTLRICRDLQFLDLSGNRLSGVLPAAITCENTLNVSSPLSLASLQSSVNLLLLNLSGNQFNGSFPGSLLATLPSVQNLSLSSNHLSGPLTDALVFESLRSLTHLELHHNRFTGQIPSSLGNCTELKELNLSFNNFTGISFNVLGTLPNLQVLDVTNNSISSKLELPSEGGNFVQLRELSLSYNFFWGPIPDSLGNISNLEALVLKYNSFSGFIPGSLGKLVNLKTLNLQFNRLNGSIPMEFSRLSSLMYLGLNRNRLKGTIMPQLSNSTGLRSLWLSENSFGGTIPPELGNFPNLVVFSLFGNYFNGTIPAGLANLSNVVAFDVSYNALSGTIPGALCQLHQLQVLLLNNNNFSGAVPGCIGNFSSLRMLDMSFNRLTGNIPSDLRNLSALTSPDQSTPAELSSATYNQVLQGQNLVWEYSESPTLFIITNNLLSGKIPDDFGLLQNLQQLRLHSNLLSGRIPFSLGNASALLLLDLSYNDLSGVIPDQLTGLYFLSSLNLSYNNLSGPIPFASQFSTFSNASFLGNKLLCGPPLQHPCTAAQSPAPIGLMSGSNERPLGKKLWPLYTILASVIVCSLFAVAFAWGCWQGKGPLSSTDADLFVDKDDQFFHVTISSALPSLSSKELAQATDYYSENNIIGDGGFGLVYKAVLDNGAVVAVKKQIEDAAQGQSEFLAEMKTLGKIKHRNLVCLLGYCAYGKERILVYEYMKNGSLDSWLHCREDGVAGLDWRTRLKVARGAAEGLAYLHHGLVPAIIHRDIKAGNILLDCDFEARLADFGLARLTVGYESHVSTDFAGTAGYIPPEYSQGIAATTKGDVYSFGVVLLEILTGRRPTDPFFRKKEMSHVVSWMVDMSMEEAVEKIQDLSSSASTDETLELMRIACLCCQDLPSRRPNMSQVVQMLESLERQQSPSRSPSVVLYEDSMSSPRCR